MTTSKLDLRMRLLVLQVVVSGLLVLLLSPLAGTLLPAALRQDRLGYLSAVWLGTLVLLVAGTWCLTRDAMAPIARIIRQVEQLGETDLAARLPVEERCEDAQHLAEVINHLLARISGSLSAQQHLSYDVAHEIRSPLTALRGQLEVTLRSERSAAEYRRVLEECLEEVLRLIRLSEDLLSLARADAGVLHDHSEQVELRQLVRQVAASRRGQASEKDLRIQLDDGPPARVQGDPELLARAVANLLDNAISYTPSMGEVGLRVEPAAYQVSVVVTDSGPGIAAEHCERVFDRFYRVDPARCRGTGGAGLGLAIVREIARSHGGSVTLESAPGHGSVFRLTVPRQEPAIAS